jgi:hypothetical protein
MKNMIEINLDIDGTIFTHDFPKIGKDIGAIPVLKALTQKGHRLIIFTMRSHKLHIDFEGVARDTLQDAIDWFKENEIPIYGIQTNPTQKQWTDSPKSYAQLMIDDSALGCPLTHNSKLSPRPFVDWVKVEEMLKERGLI